MASNGHISADSLGRRMDEFHNSWESLIDRKPSYFNSILTSFLNSHIFTGGNV